MKNERHPWVIQVQFKDKEMTACSMAVFKRMLKGTGVEVDASYPPTRVAPGRFVGRGLATKGALKKALARTDVHLFKEIKLPEPKIKHT